MVLDFRLHYAILKGVANLHWGIIKYSLRSLLIDSDLVQSYTELESINREPREYDLSSWDDMASLKYNWLDSDISNHHISSGESNVDLTIQY
jgi:hypothetical protein